MFIVRDNITVAPGVTRLTGIFTANGSFSTGSDGDDEQLEVTGSVAASAVNLQRDLVGGNATGPAELFTYSPELVINYPPALSERHLVWREVAP
jgi:hypothetical protein